MAAELAVAYLNTQYPSLSHTFIEREIRSVRAAGVRVQPFSIRRPDATGRLSPAHIAAERETIYVVDGLWSMAVAQLWAIMTRPIGCIRALWRAMTLSPPGIRQRLLHLAYAVEAARLVRELSKKQLSHIHVHMANNGAALAIIAGELDRSLSYSLSIHGSFEFFNIDTHRLADKVQGAQFVRCISHFCRAQVMVSSSPNVWNGLHIVHCGVDVAEFRSDRHERLPMHTIRLLTVGRMHSIKGYEVLLRACADIDQREVDWVLDMVGDGPELEHLKSLARELDIESRVIFSGAVGADDIVEHYRRADLFVLSSFMEGVPVVLMEAMAMETPVIATQVGGVPELVQDNVSGWLVPPGSKHALTAAIAFAFHKRDQLPSMGRLGRQFVEAEFSSSASGRAMARLFTTYLARHPARPVAADSFTGAQALPPQVAGTVKG